MRSRVYGFLSHIYSVPPDSQFVARMTDGSIGALLETLLAAPKYRRILQFLQVRGRTILFALIILDWMSPVSIIGSVFTGIIRGYFALAGLK